MTREEFVLRETLMGDEVKPRLNPTAAHWCISSGRGPVTGERVSIVSGSWGPFCREDDEIWWQDRAPSAGWASTVEEAWRRWEEQMLKWAEDAQRRADDLRADVARMRHARGVAVD